MQQAPALQQPYLQILLDSFRGELRAYGGDLPTEPYEVSSWGHFVEAATILPELATACHRLIEKRLGYRPPESMMQPQEAFLRALIQQHRNGYLTDAEFGFEADDCIQVVRNQDMQVPSWTVDTDVIEKRYASYLPAYGDRARERLTRYLGYAPELEHSVIVELWLRQVIARERYALPESKTPLDCKAVMLVQYREAFAVGGRRAANSLPLPSDTTVLD